MVACMVRPASFPATSLADRTNFPNLRPMRPLFLTMLPLLLLHAFAPAQNVGIGTSSPLDRLHVAGAVRVNTLATADTTVTLADLNGRLHALPAGPAGQVLTSQGAGRAPRWAAAGGGGGAVYTSLLTAVTSATVSNLGSPAMILLSKTITPVNDTVLVTFTANAIVTASTVPAAPLVHYGFQIRTGITTYKEFWTHPHTNTAGLGINQGKMHVAFTYPVAVTPGVPVNINIFLRAQNTASGSQTIQFDTGAMWGSAAMIIQDVATN